MGRCIYDFYLTFLGIPIADSIEKLNAMEWRQDFYDYLQNDPSSFLSDLSNEDFDVDGLTVDDLSFEVKQTRNNCRHQDCRFDPVGM